MEAIGALEADKGVRLVVFWPVCPVLLGFSAHFSERVWQMGRYTLGHAKPAFVNMTNAINLAGLLRAETKSLHAAAERAGIMSAFLRGQIDRKIYCRLLRNFVEIYAALEAALELHAAQPALKALRFPALKRCVALRGDLQFLHGKNWAAEISLANSGAHYVERIDWISTHDPELLIAHTYVRYLGDLSGGQMLRNIVGSALQLQGEAGIGFYIFDAPGASALAASYRQRLQDIEVNAGLAARVVEEAQSAFRRHVDLFEELAATPPFT